MLLKMTSFKQNLISSTFWEPFTEAKPKNNIEMSFRQTPKKGLQILLQILKPLSDTGILTPELVGDQIKMVA